MELLVAALFIGQDVKKVFERVENYEAPAYITDFGTFEKSLGLKLRNFGVIRFSQTHKMSILVQFDKDLEDDEVADLRKVFATSPTKDGSPPAGKSYRFVWLDADNVILHSHPVEPSRIEGEITGVQGEGFRVYYDKVGQAPFDKAIKLQIRPIGRQKSTPKDEKK